jgi:Family of unknown function (DUF6263)
MNVWRWLGLFLFFAALTCFVGTRLPVYAGEKDKKDKKDDTTKDKKVDQKDEKKQEAKGNGGKLDFKAFDEGAKPFFQEVKTETIQTMKVQGQDVTQKQDQTFYIQWTPDKKDKEGNYVVKQKVVGVKMNIDIGGNKIAYDSTVPPDKQPKNPMTDFFSALMKQELTFTIKPNLEIVKIDGREEFIKNLSDTNPAIKTLLDTIMSKEALKQMAEPTWWAVPTTSEKTWSKTSELNLGPIGKYDTKFTFTREGGDDKMVKIKIDAKLDYSQPKDKSGLPFTIKKAELVSKSGTGEAVFDATKGRLDSSKLTMKLEGNLTIEVGNMATDITLNQDQTSTTKTSDTNPVETKK